MIRFAFGTAVHSGFRVTGCLILTAFIGPFTIASAGTVESTPDHVLWLHSSLKQFKLNPKAFRLQTSDTLELSPETRAARARIEDQIRSRASRPGVESERWATGLDEISTFLDDTLTETPTPIIRNFHSLAGLRLEKSQLPHQAWSDTYWPNARGGIGNRYASPGFADLEKWSALYAFVNEPTETAQSIYQAGNPARINELSPGEKYDLLIGDLSDSPGGYVTPKAWKDGARTVDKNGEVADWMGLCHGWAPASFNSPRPLHAVTVMAFDGRTPLTFYPSDIKGLVDLAWANGDYDTRLIGRRCPEVHPKTDYRTGRPLNKDCLGVNPADWHMAALHQLGLRREGFVLDIALDSEVWNQPVQKYSITYFNPATGEVTDDPVRATAARSEMAQDPFASFRPAAMESVVGVAMEITYGDETEPSHSRHDSEKKDATKKVTYIYDLELDGSGTMIGGEWYQGKHPSMIWNVPKIRYPRTQAEARSGETWRRGESLPRQWSHAAKIDAKVSQIPGELLERLVDWANE